MKHLILGGARSGKSCYAEQQAEALAKQNNQQLIYVATATAGDTEMSERIQQHQNRRSKCWHLVEESLQLADIIHQYNDEKYCILIDCLTLWISNGLVMEQWSSFKQAFLTSLSDSKATMLIVSNEVGSGIVPMGQLSRQFVDESGWLHQSLAASCDSVVLIVAGLPLKLKDTTK